MTLAVTGSWAFSDPTQRVCRALTAAGFQALFVGGCVRNDLLGAPVSDIDIATDALPTDVMAQAKAAGLKSVPTGIDHGTITVVADGLPHEITTFRRDVDTDGRHATVAYATDIATDAARRDFTMNALYADPTGRILDPLGGLPDLTERRVRFIGNAVDRLREDHLRALRYFRFTAWYGDPALGFDPEALAAIAETLDALNLLSAERVTSELIKTCAAPDPAPALASMQSVGVLAQILPGTDAQFIAPLVHVEQVLNVVADPMVRLAALGPVDVLTTLRLSKAQARAITVLREGVEGGQGAAELAYRHGETRAKQIIALRAALLSDLPDPDDVARAAKGAKAVFPISARDLMPEYSGAALGARLAELETRWIASDFTLNRDQLLG